MQLYSSTRRAQPNWSSVVLNTLDIPFCVFLRFIHNYEATVSLWTYNYETRWSFIIASLFPEDPSNQNYLVSYSSVFTYNDGKWYHNICNFIATLHTLFGSTLLSCTTSSFWGIILLFHLKNKVVYKKRICGT